MKLEQWGKGLICQIIFEPIGTFLFFINYFTNIFIFEHFNFDHFIWVYIDLLMFFFVFCFFGLRYPSADKLTIHSVPCSRFFQKPTILQSPPSHLPENSICNNARLEFSTICVPSFDPNEWCLNNGLHGGGLNPGPLGHESSALTTRPRLLTKTC